MIDHYNYKLRNASLLSLSDKRNLSNEMKFKSASSLSYYSNNITGITSKSQDASESSEGNSVFNNEIR